MKMNKLVNKGLLPGLIAIFLGLCTFSFSQSTTDFLPKPKGPFQIGTTELFLTDSSRINPLERKEYRRLYIKIWYPAVPNKGQKVEAYLSTYPTETIYETFKSKKLPLEWMLELQKYPTHSYSEAPIIVSDSNLPVIIFNPGYYFGLPELYTAMMEALASQGYIVCSINHPYEQPYMTFPPNQVMLLKRKRAQWAYLQLVVANFFQWKPTNSPENVEEITRYYHRMLHRFNKVIGWWVADSRFFVDYISDEKHRKSHSILGKMDLSAIGAFGQSVGGAVTGELCQEDLRVKAGINLDCFQFGTTIDNPMKQPFMLVQSDYNPKWNLGNTVNFKNTISDFSFLSFPNASHFLFSDGAVMPYQSTDLKNSMVGKIDGAEALVQLNDYLVDFFDMYLKGKEPKLIAKPSETSILTYEFKKGNQ